MPLFSRALASLYLSRSISPVDIFFWLLKEILGLLEIPDCAHSEFAGVGTETARALFLKGAV